MAFMDKLKDAASIAGEKAGDAMEIGKLKSRLASEDKEMSVAYKEIGSKIFDKLAQMDEIPPEVKEFLPDGILSLVEEIRKHKTEIESINAAIERVKEN